MARKVFISSDMSIDEAVSEVAERDPVSALIWPWVLTCFDDWGRAKASPREIKNSTFPANDLVTMEVISNAITLYGMKLVHLYESDGKPYMCINPDKWFKYQTHIRREKRDNDGSKHPAPFDAYDAQVRASTRGNAQSANNLTNRIPSPSPSPSLTKDTTNDFEIIRVRFRELHGLMDIHIDDYMAITKLLEDGIPRTTIIKVVESRFKPKARTIKYYEAAIREAHHGVVAVRQIKKYDPELESRNIEIARNQWISEGNDPSGFVYKPASGD